MRSKTPEHQSNQNSSIEGVQTQIAALEEQVVELSKKKGIVEAQEKKAQERKRKVGPINKELSKLHGEIQKLKSQKERLEKGPVEPPTPKPKRQQRVTEKSAPAEEAFHSLDKIIAEEQSLHHLIARLRGINKKHAIAGLKQSIHAMDLVAEELEADEPRQSQFAFLLPQIIEQDGLRAKITSYIDAKMKGEAEVVQTPEPEPVPAPAIETEEKEEKKVEAPETPAPVEESKEEILSEEKKIELIAGAKSFADLHTVLSTIDGVPYEYDGDQRIMKPDQLTRKIEIFRTSSRLTIADLLKEKTAYYIPDVYGLHKKLKELFESEKKTKIIFAAENVDDLYTAMEEVGEFPIDDQSGEPGIPQKPAGIKAKIAKAWENRNADPLFDPESEMYVSNAFGLHQTLRRLFAEAFPIIVEHEVAPAPAEEKKPKKRSKRESVDAEWKEKIQNAETFDQLYAILNEVGIIESSTSDTVYTADEMIKRIDLYRKDEADLKTITNSLGIRGRAELLKRKEKYLPALPEESEAVDKVAAVIAAKPPESMPASETDVWEQEKKEAEADLDTYRPQIVEGETKFKQSKGGKLSRLYRWARKKFNSKLQEEDDIAEKQHQDSMKKAVEEYTKAQKRYANAVAQAEWVKKRDGAGDIPYGSEQFKKADLEIRALQIQKAVIPEYDRYKQALIDAEPKRENKMIRGVIEGWRKVPKVKRILIGATICTVPAAVAASIVSPMIVSGLVAQRALRSTIGTLVGGSSAAIFGRFRRGHLLKKHEEAQQKLSESYSIFNNLNQAVDMQKEYERRLRRVDYEQMGIAFILGGSSSALVDGIGGVFLDNPLQASAPIKASEPVLEKNTVVPLEKPSATVAAPTPVQVSNPAAAPEALDVSEVQGEVQQVSAAEVADVPEKPKVMTFENEIRDHARGSRTIGDSAELSAKRIFENNAKELGYERSSGMSVKKWAIMRVEELVREHPEVRNAVTHDGNNIKIGFNQDGSVASVEIEKGTAKLTPTVEGTPITSETMTETETLPEPETSPVKEPAAEAAPTREPEAETPSDLEIKQQYEKLPLESDEDDEATDPSFKLSLDMTEKQEQFLPDAEFAEGSHEDVVTPEILTQAVSLEMPHRISSVFPPKTSWFFGSVSPFNDERWIAASNLKAEALLQTTFGNVPEFLRVNNLPAGISRTQLESLQGILKQGKELGVIERGMNVGDVVRKVVEVDQRKQLLTLVP